MKFNSSYWYDDFQTDDIIIDQLSDKEKKSLDLYKLKDHLKRRMLTSLIS